MNTALTPTPAFGLGVGDLVITLDMDGTLEDPWACCGRRSPAGGTPTCRHLRADTVQRVANLRAVYPHAKLVVLSWRSGMEQVTRTWLAEVGIDVAAVFVPGSADSARIGAGQGGQVAFKVGVVKALRRAGVHVLTSLDDNAAVIAALHAIDVPAILAPRIVTVAPHEWAAGYLGAPKRDRLLRWGDDFDVYND